MNFDENSELGKELKKWWENLRENKGIRAEFQRAKNVKDIILLSSFHLACNRFNRFFTNENHWETRLAMILGLLSHVKGEYDGKLAEQMASPGKDSPALSELRFRRLIQCDRDEFYVRMIRVIRLLKREANLHDLARSCYYWGDKIKRDWAFGYFPHIKDN